jgi:putative membrane protein
MTESIESPSSPQDREAVRRTRLANERTYLAWWRTGLTSFAVSIGTGRIVPAVTDEQRWPYAIVGAGFAVLGVLVIGYGLMRQRAVERAVEAGVGATPDEHWVALLAALGVLLGLAVVALVVVNV